MSTNYLSDKSLDFWYDFLGLNYYMYLVKEKIQLALKFQYYCFSVFKTFRFKEIDQYCAFMLTKLTLLCADFYLHQYVALISYFDTLF